MHNLGLQYEVSRKDSMNITLDLVLILKVVDAAELIVILFV